MRKKLLILSSVTLLFLTLAILWWKQAVKPANPMDEKNIDFTIVKGEPIRNIAERLQKKGIIRSSVAFFLVARFGNLAENIQAGEFLLNPSMNLYTIGDTLKVGKTDIKITIPEGFRKEEIAMLLTKELNFPENEFLKYAKEGYLFPDTYFIPKEATAGSILTYMTQNFDKKAAEIIIKANAKNISLNELITIASMVEREAKYPEDRLLIASVIKNRLKIGMKLDIDATIQYALGFQNEGKTWWKRNLTLDDLSFDSPYNTYKNPGLPPDPISNPGLSSIEAVVLAPENDYLYYVADSKGKSHFAGSLEEHNQNISKYLTPN